MLLVALLLYPGHSLGVLDSSVWLRACLLGLVITITQWSFLFGLARTTPFMSALLIGSSVPMAVVSDLVAGYGSVASGPMALSLLYLGFAIAAGRSKDRRPRTKAAEESGLRKAS